MDCKTARNLIDFARPRAPELDVDETEALHEHLAECPVCHALADSEWRVDDHFGRAMQALPVPSELRQRLLSWLHRERRAWYSRFVWAPTAAAAAIVLAFGIGTGVWQRWNSDSHVKMAVEWPRELRHEVEQQFRDLFGLTVVAPPQFNYEYVKPIALGEYQGTQAPQLRFERGDYSAVVYVLSDEHFDLNHDPEKRDGFLVTVLRHPSNSHIVYVIYFTGTSLERFLEHHGQHAV